MVNVHASVIHVQRMLITASEVTCTTATNLQQFRPAMEPLTIQHGLDSSAGQTAYAQPFRDSDVPISPSTLSSKLCQTLASENM